MAFRWVAVVALSMGAVLTAQGPPPPTPARQAAPARDSAREAPATATIRGKVTAAANGQPLHRVKVTLNGAVANPPTAVTDTRGEFTLTQVPAGTFTITAVRAGYLTLQYGQRRPQQAGRPIKVENGQTIEGVDFALVRGGVLAGRVTDELGEPMPGTRVEAVELSYVRGRRISVAARIAATDDTGEYRLAGLEPGSYQIRASTRDVWEADDGQATFTYALTYYPGVTAADRPQTIKLEGGQQAVGLDFGMVPGRTARITGVVEDNGAPQSGQLVHLSEIGRTIGGALMYSGPGGTTRTDANGAFEFINLPAGEYLVISGGPNNTVAPTVVVQPGEARHVVLSLSKPAATSGSIVTDEGIAPPFSPARVGVLPIAVAPDSVLPLWGAPRDATPKADWTFTIPDVDGPYLFRVTGLPDDWMLKRVIAGGRDYTDTPLTVRRGGADIGGLQVVLTRKGARLTGKVVDGAGASAPDTTIIVFADDPAKWGVGSRFVKAVRPDGSGRFSVGGLPPGVYRAIAIDEVTDGEWEDPEFLDSLARRATKIELAEGASETITLTQESRQ